jgi:hypothetical protein
MPINYYCAIAMNGSDIEMNRNELLLPVIDNETSAPATGNEVKGQMYMDTTANVMYFYNGTAWIEMDGTGSGVASLTINNGLSTYVDLTNSGTAENPILDADLNAADGTDTSGRF